MSEFKFKPDHAYPAGALPADQTQTPIPVMTPDGTIVAVQIGTQLIPVQAPNATSRVLRQVPLDEAISDILDVGRETLGTLQKQRYIARAVREFDYSDQFMGRPRKALANFQDNKDHNRTREEVVRAGRAQLTNLTDQANRIMMEQVTFLGAQITAAQNTDIQRLQLELDMEYSESERDRRHELAVLDRQHHQEQYLALLQAGQQLPDLMRELADLQKRNPSTAVETTLALMQTAMGTYQTMVTTADKAAQAQMAELLKPMMTLVIQKALGEIRKDGA